MSLLKKQWRFTVSAVIALCVLLLGAVALYRASKPQESKTVSEDNIVHVSSDVVADAQRYRAWRQEYDEYLKRGKRIEDKADEWWNRFNAISDEFYSTLSPADRASLRAGLPEEARQWWPTLFDDVTPSRPPNPDIKARRQSLLSEGIALENQMRQLSPPPAPSPQHSHKEN